MEYSRVVSGPQSRSRQGLGSGPGLRICWMLKDIVDLDPSAGKMMIWLAFGLWGGAMIFHCRYCYLLLVGPYCIALGLGSFLGFQHGLMASEEDFVLISFDHRVRFHFSVVFSVSLL